MPTSWLQLSLRTAPALFDPVANFLIERGSPGVVIQRRALRAYFARSSVNESIRGDVRRFLRAIRKLFPPTRAPKLRWTVLKDEHWNHAWRRFIKPAMVGKSLWVTPPWAPPPKSLRRQAITIEPGMAFGTGTHATTRGCLEFIEQASAAFRGAAFDALDVGTGSGILAIALAKLGARKVWALDNDPVALRVARENIRRNGVQGKVRPAGTDLIRIRRSFPLVVANLTAPTILDLAPALKKKVAPGGCLILAGILRGEAGRVIRRFDAEDFQVSRRKPDKEWITLLLKRN